MTLGTSKSTTALSHNLLRGAQSPCSTFGAKVVTQKPTGLKPSDAPVVDNRCDSCSFKPQAIKSNNELSFALAAIVGFCGVASVFFAFVAVKYYKKYRSIKEKHGQMKANF